MIKARLLLDLFYHLLLKNRDCGIRNRKNNSLYGGYFLYNRLMDTDTLINEIIKWGKDKGLNDVKSQMNKVIEEVGEIAHEVTRNRNGAEFDDAIGDSLVTLIILASINGKDPRDCLESAYNEIKDRVGKTENGTFIKS